MSLSSSHLKLMYWPTVTRPQSNRASLECAETGDLNHGYAFNNVHYQMHNVAAHSTCVTLSCQHGHVNKN